jgi:hypothetical protein
MKIASLLILAIVLGACERRIMVKLEDGMPPRFELSGNGRLGNVLIFGPEQERIAETNPADDTYAVWEIGPQRKGEEGAARLEDLRVITYGIVPPGYQQIKPATGQAPALLEGSTLSLLVRYHKCSARSRLF